MRRTYDRSFQPPAAVVDVQLRAPRGRDALTLRGKIDSGADVCGLPMHCLDALDLRPERLVRAAGFAGALTEAAAYRFDLQLGGTWLERLEALATGRPYVIVGRNALRHFVVTLHGPRGVLTLRGAQPGRRP